MRYAFHVRNEGTVVQIVEEYRRYARECRVLAERMTSPNDRQALELQAIAWEKIANQREAAIADAITNKTPLKYVP
jgi:hypothetical protein